ncbi:hypothetical protein J3R82DRAFT_2992 [Butyriboletus roseoflavus]|nr:hypothetical protein J3R82DRAFT_2992 [Butyriboletus roseoflavus]
MVHSLFKQLELPEIILEMEQATGVLAQQLIALHPKLSGIQEKLSLASTRVMTLIEDAAYSLLGIFSVTGILAIYGEGESALGHFLAYILPGSGDVSILAGTGQSSSYNSCLPARITVYNQRATSHLPLPIADAEMETVVTTLRTSGLDLDLALKLYDRLNELSAPWFAGSWMKLPCIAFKLPSLSRHRTTSGHAYRMETSTFRMVEIKMRQDLSWLKSLYLVHSWLDMLLDCKDMQSGTFGEGDDDDEAILTKYADDDVTEPSWLDADEDNMSDKGMDDDSLLVPEPESPSPSSLHAVAMDPVAMDKETHVLWLVAHLGQPFGALLFTMASMCQWVVVYKRVAADSLITVHMQKNVPLTDLYEHICILDVL